MRLDRHPALVAALVVLFANASFLWCQPAMAQGRTVAAFVVPKTSKQLQAATVMSSILREQMGKLEGIEVRTGAPPGNLQAAIEAERLAGQGFTALNTGNKTGALEAFQKAYDVLAQNPGVGSIRLHARVAKGLGVSSFMNGKTDKGKELIKRSLLLYPAQSAREYAYTVDTRNMYEFAKRQRDDLARGSIEVRSTPDGAEVFVDGGFKGYTPITIPEMAAGSHLVEVVKDGYLRWSTAALVPEGGRVPTEAVLTTSPNRAQLDSALSGVKKAMGKNSRFQSAARDLMTVTKAGEALVLNASLGATGFVLEGHFMDLAGQVKTVKKTIARDANFYSNIEKFLADTLGAAPRALAKVEGLGSPPAETVDTVMKESASTGGDLAIDPDSPLFQVEDDSDEESITDKWWFWTIIGVGAAAVAGTVTAIVLTAGDDDSNGGAVGNLSITLERFGD
jgi:hypothetical protein